MKERKSRKKKTGFARKSLGQNFLTEPRYIDQIVRCLNPQPDDTVLEIGPGRGALTEPLIKRSGKVIAIEIDPNLISILREKFSDADNFVLIQKDALEVDFEMLLNLQSLPSKTKLAANLPYYISTAILQHLIQYRFSFSDLVVMLQKEVVERISAKPGNRDRGFLTVLIEAYFDSEVLFEVPQTAFRPVPKVTSAVLRLTPKREARIRKSRDDLFRKLVSLAFREKRKTIANNLKRAENLLFDLIQNNGGVSGVLAKAGIDPKSRAETVSGKEWLALVDLLADGSEC